MPLALPGALDAKQGIEGGFTDVPDCSDTNRKSDKNGDGSSNRGGSFSDWLGQPRRRWRRRGLRPSSLPNTR